MEITGYLRHITMTNETPNILALKYYNNEFMASYILEANVEFNDVIVYEGEEEIVIPIFNTIEDDSTLHLGRGSKVVKLCNNYS